MDKQCKWCKEWFSIVDKPKGWMANHTRWCLKNPKRKDYLKKLKNSNNINLMNEARKKSGFTNQFAKAKIKGEKIEHSLKGKKHPTPFKKHTQKSKEKIRDKALKSNHRRLRKGVVEYRGILLDSSWEVALAKRLDELKIQWERPTPIKWVDAEGIEHNYFPDFYLTEHDLYLDPKNPAAYANQKEKIEVLKKTYSNLQFILTLEDCENFNI